MGTGQSNNRTKPSKTAGYFVDAAGALRFLQGEWGPRAKLGPLSRWMFLDVAALWARLAEVGDIDRNTRGLLDDVDELLAVPLKKLQRRGVTFPELVVRVTERVKGEKRVLEYARVSQNGGGWAFVCSADAANIPGFHPADVEKASQREFADAFAEVQCNWVDRFTDYDPNKLEEVRFRLEAWWRRYTEGRRKAPQYVNERGLLALLIKVVGKAFALEMPRPQHVRALAILAGRQSPVGHTAAAHSDLARETDSWRKAIKALPRLQKRLLNLKP